MYELHRSDKQFRALHLSFHIEKLQKLFWYVLAIFLISGLCSLSVIPILFCCVLDFVLDIVS